MVSPLFFYQLTLIALVWLCLMLQWMWPSDSAACPTIPEPIPPLPKRKREPTPFAGRELLRLLLQDHVDNHGSGRREEAVCGSDGVRRSHKRDHMETGYKSVFGAVRVARTG